MAAAVVLALDGAALVGIGWRSRRPGFILVGAIFLLAAVLVRFSWRWYRRRVDDIAVARRALREEALDLQRVLRDRQK